VLIVSLSSELFARLHANLSECAKRWQQSLNPDLDRSEWCEKEVCSRGTIKTRHY
jgi:hypothetical protein